MAISRIGFNSSALTTVTVAAHAIGDYIIIFAYRNATTAPTLPAGYTSIVTGSGNTNSYRVGYKIATATNDASGTWANANVLESVVYRGVTGIGTTSAATKAAATTATIPTLTLLGLNSKSWVLAFAGSRQVVAQGTPLAGATNLLGTQAGTTSNAMMADTNATVSSFAATTSANNSSVTSSGGSIELLCSDLTETLMDNYSGVAPDTNKWVSYFDTGCSVTESGGLRVLTLDTDATSNAGDESLRHYDLTGSYALAKLGSVSYVSGQTMQFLLPYLHLVNDINAIYWRVDNDGVLRCITRIAAAETSRGSVTYNAATTSWLRIRESAGTIYWDYSADGKSWTNSASFAVASLFDVRDMIQGSQISVSGVVTAGHVDYDYFNSPTPNSLPLNINQSVNRAGTY